MEREGERERKRKKAGKELVSRDVDPSTRDLEPLIGPVWLGRRLGRGGVGGGSLGGFDGLLSLWLRARPL